MLVALVVNGMDTELILIGLPIENPNVNGTWNMNRFIMNTKLLIVNNCCGRRVMCLSFRMRLQKVLY